ncbi:MAG: RNA polymerase sigma factor [Planctomycetota bacterium]
MILSDEALARLSEGVAGRLSELPAAVAGGDFLDNLLARIVRRYPAVRNLEDEELAPGSAALSDLEGGAQGAIEFVLRELVVAVDNPYFPLVQEVALNRSDRAVEQLMAMLERNLRVRGILYRHGLDPDRDYPAVWGKIWESIPKWDGRDFRAYVARILRNACLDEISRKKKRPASIDDTDPRDPRPPVQTGAVVAARDALQFLMAVLDELEASGRIKALDGVIFGLISQGRSVADIVGSLRLSGVPARFAAAIDALGGVTGAEESVILRFLLDGLTSEEIASLTGRAEAEVERAAAALGRLDDPEELLLARELSREGLSVKDLERAERLTTNAINLCINRIRLKVWMAIVDRAYESLRRRGDVTEVELAIVAHRCEHAPRAGCRMYKDSTCKREVDPSRIARKAGLDLDGPALARHMAELRRKVVEEGLGMNFPDYNACLIERKPLRKPGDER